MKRFFAAVMSVVMAALLVTAIAAPAAAGFGGSENADLVYDASTRTLTITVSAKAFNDIADARTVTKEDISALLPQNLVNSYKEHGIMGFLATGEIVDLMSRAEFFQIIPENVFADPSVVTAANIQKDPGLVKSMLTDIVTNATGIKVNGVEVLDTTAGKIDAGKAEEAVLSGLPATEGALASAVAADGIVGDYEIVFDYTDVAKASTDLKVKIGFDVSDSSQKSKLVSYFNKIADEYLKYTIDASGKKISVEQFVPVEFSEVVTEFMNSGSVTNETKLELLKVLNGTVQDAIDFIEARNVNNLVNGLTSTSNQAANDLAGYITDAQAKDAEKVNKAFDAVVELLKMGTEGITADKFADMYDGAGVWSESATFEKTAEDLIDFIAEKTDDTLSKAKLLVTGTVSLQIEDKVTFEDLFRTTFHIGEEAFSVYLPTGYNFSDINTVLAVAESSEIAYKITEIANWGKSTDGGATISEIVTATEGEDIDVYPCFTVKFNDGTSDVKEMLVAAGYIIKAEDIPAVPTKDGYAAGEWYCVEDATKAPLNFQVDQDSNFTVDYTAETTAEETTVEETTAANPNTGVDVDNPETGVPNIVYALGLIALISAAGIAIGLGKKKVN